MKILFLSHHWNNNSHHSKHSGFQRIVHFAAELHNVTLITWGEEEMEYQDGPIRVMVVKGPRRDYFFTRRKAISKKAGEISGLFDVVHALYSDCTFGLTAGSFTVTFHVLPGVVHYNTIKQKLFLFLKYHFIQKKALAGAKHIAVVSRNLLAAIPGKFREKARFIPHGVDTDFWNPALAGTPRSIGFSEYVLCVGAHGLDRALLTDFIRINTAIQFVLVGLKQKLEPLSNAHYLYELPDEELRDLYAGCRLVIRPLLFATANNSILESLSMGKTILTNRIDGVTDYLNDDSCVFIDEKRMIDFSDTGGFYIDPVIIREMAIKTFDWRRIFALYETVYPE